MPKLMSKSLMSKSLVSALILSTGLAGATLAFAGESDHNLINFEVSVQQEVPNNQATASLNKTASAKTPKELANKLNPIINQAIAIAKKYPSVQVSTGSQHAYPEYSKGKIIGVTGSASLTLKSQDTDALSDLLAELQSILVLESLDFSVSDDLQKATTAKLREQATQQFQQEAQTLAKLWHAGSYRLINAQMNTSGQNFYRAKHYAYGVAVAEQASDASRQTLEAGNSTITYSINGTIQLVGR